jgi:hypothetical protein
MTLCAETSPWKKRWLSGSEPLARLTWMSLSQLVHPEPADIDAAVLARRQLGRSEQPGGRLYLAQEAVELLQGLGPPRIPSGPVPPLRPGSAEEFLKDGGGPWRKILVGEELRADLYCGFSGVNPDDVRKEAQVIDVAGPSSQCLHREDVSR